MTAIPDPFPNAAADSRARAETSVLGSKILIGLLTLRWIAGIVENLGIPNASEIFAVLMLLSLATLSFAQMRIAQSCAWFAFGLSVWIFTGAISFTANNAAGINDASALFMLLTLYLLFANAAALYIRSLASLIIVRQFLVAFILVGFCLSLVQVLTNTGFAEAGKEHIVRAFGSDVHPVSFAIQTLSVLVGLEIIRIKLGRPVTLMYLGLVTLGCIAIYLTYARTAWVMAFLTFGGMMLLTGSNRRRLICATLFAGITIFGLFSSERFADLQSLPLFMSNFAFSDAVFDYRYIDNSVSWRIVNWSYGLRQAMDQPILGFGPGQSAASSYFGLEMHNIFLEMLFEGGVLGLLAFLIVLSGLWHMHFRLPKIALADRTARIAMNIFGISLLFAVTFSTSLVDQLMSVLIYVLILTATAVPSKIA